MRRGDLVRFRSIGFTTRRENLFIVMGPEHRLDDMPRSDDVFKIMPASLVGEILYCYRYEVEVINETRRSRSTK